MRFATVLLLVLGAQACGSEGNEPVMLEAGAFGSPPLAGAGAQAYWSKKADYPRTYRAVENSCGEVWGVPFKMDLHPPREPPSDAAVGLLDLYGPENFYGLSFSALEGPSAGREAQADLVGRKVVGLQMVFVDEDGQAAGFDCAGQLDRQGLYLQCDDGRPHVGRLFSCEMLMTRGGDDA